MQAKHDGWLMKKLAFLQGGRPGKRRFDVPNAGRGGKDFPEFQFNPNKLESEQLPEYWNDPELGWDVIWENGLPYREDRMMIMHDGYGLSREMREEGVYKYHRSKHRVYTWRFPREMIEIPENLRGVIDVSGTPVRLVKKSYVHVTSDVYWLKYRGTDKLIPQFMCDCHGYEPNDQGYLFFEPGTIMITAGRVLTDRPDRPDVFIILTSHGPFYIHSPEMFEPL